MAKLLIRAGAGFRGAKKSRSHDVAAHVRTYAKQSLKIGRILHARLGSEGQTLYLIAHECAHVEVTKTFDKAFPGFLLRHRFADVEESFRWQVIKACWDEYAACRISAPFGAEDTLSGLEETFILALQQVKDAANAHIRDYRLDQDLERVWGEVVGKYGDGMKFASRNCVGLHGLHAIRRVRI